MYRALSPLPALMVGLAVAACAPATDQATQPPFDANAEIETWVELWNTYDLNGVERLFLGDERVSYFSSETEGLIRGPVSVREHHAGFGFVAGGTEAEQELWVEDVHGSTFENAAVVGAIWYFGDRADVAAAARGPMTAVYVLDGNDYKIAHMHFANY